MNNQSESNLEYGDVAFRLLDEYCCLVEPIRPSGMQGELYILDQEGNFASKTSMVVRVIGLGRKCSLTLGSVYIVPVYAWEDMPFEGETWHVMHEANAKAEVAGYDA